MYAIVEIAGQQFKVEEGKKIFVHRLEAEEGSEVVFDKVLLIEDNDKVIIGEPTIKDFIVEGKVIDRVRGDKVIIFKKKRKKGYRIKNGHRQNFTQIEIISIGEKGESRKATPKKEESKVSKTKVAEEPVVEKKATQKKAGAKKPAGKKEVKEEVPAKKPAAKKTAEKKPAARKTSKGKE
jgi:large subunit ribosomal protein L21